MKKKPDKITPQELKSLHHEQRNAIRKRLTEFSQVPRTEYFYELLYCLLTPQSSAVNADKAVRVLRTNNIFFEDIDPEPLLHQKEYYIRFHKTKAKHISAMKKQFPVIEHHLSNGSTGVEIREWLVSNVQGLGWKESSHFLRNIGYRNLAILDRHILRNLVRTGALRFLPKTLTTQKYLSIEKKFRTFSDSVGIPMDELDLLFWSMETGEILK
jgi:N-glycosylase/DNA lyase